VPGCLGSAEDMRRNTLRYCALRATCCLDAPAVLEAEINPLIVKAAGEGVVAVDGVVKIDTAG